MGGSISPASTAGQVAQQSFMATKNLYSKASGTFFYHYVQSFSPQENVTPAQAWIALGGERFFPGCGAGGHHVDAEHPTPTLRGQLRHPDTEEAPLA